MLKTKRDINQQKFKIVHLHFVKSKHVSLTRSCGSSQRDTTRSGWKFQLNNLAVKGLKLAGSHNLSDASQKTRDIEPMWRNAGSE